MPFQSNAEEIRHYLKQLLEDGQPHSRTELFNYVNSNSSNGCSFTVGMLSGALKTLTDSSDVYVCVQRGVYQKRGSDPMPAAPAVPVMPVVSAAPVVPAVPAAGGIWDTKMDDLAQILSNAKEEINTLFTFNYLDMPSFSQEDLRSLQKVKAFVSSIDSLLNEIS